MNRELTTVEREERELKKKEAELAAKELKLEKGSWGEDGDAHEIHMEPLIIRHPFHHETTTHKGSSELSGSISKIMEGLAQKLNSIRKPGAASDHSLHIIPLSDLLHPGAHPNHGGNQDMHQHKDTHEHNKPKEHHVNHVTKEDEEHRHPIKIE